jgi:hypothetical protein
MKHAHVIVAESFDNITSVAGYGRENRNNNDGVFVALRFANGISDAKCIHRAIIPKEEAPAFALELTA